MSNALHMRLNWLHMGDPQSVNWRILITTLMVGSLSLAVNLLATAKELVVAHQFGTGDSLDALLIAFLLPSFAINVIAGSLSTAVIPTFVQVREKDGPGCAKQLFSGIVATSAVVLLGASVLLGLTASLTLPVMGSGFSAEKVALTRSLFFMCLPVLFISGLGTIWAAILNASERFTLVAISPLVKPGVGIIFLLAVHRWWGIYALAGGLLSGALLEACLLAWGVSRQGFCLIPRRLVLNSDMKKIINQFTPMVAGALLMSGTTLIDQSMAGMLGPGSISTLNYGGKIVALVIGTASLSLGTAVFPHLSRFVAASDWHAMQSTLKIYTRLVLYITVPLTMILVCFSEPIVRLLFERGAFTFSDTHLVGQVQALYLLQVPFYIKGVLVVRCISSLKRNDILLQAAAINLFAKIALNYILIQKIGLSGIALSTSVVYLISYLYCSYKLKNEIQSCA